AHAAIRPRVTTLGRNSGSDGLRRLVRDEVRRDVAVGHVRAVRDARARIVAAHDAFAIVADGVQALDRRAVALQHFARDARADAIERAEIAHDDLDGIERTLRDRRYARIRLHVGIGEIAIERRRAARELEIPAVHGARVVFADRRLETGRVDAGV